MAKTLSNNENKILLSNKIATDTAAYLKQGGKIKVASSHDNAGYASLIKKSRKQEAANLKKRRNFSLSGGPTKIT